MRGQGRGNSHQYRLGLLEYFVVPEAQDPEAVAGEMTFPAAIIFSAFGVLSAVNLDDESSAGAAEVNDVRAYRVLTPEPGSGEVAIP